MNAHTGFGRAVRGRQTVAKYRMPQSTAKLQPVEYFWQPFSRGWILAFVIFAVAGAIFEMAFWGYELPGVIGWTMAVPQLLYGALMILGALWLYVMFVGNPYAVRMDEKGLDMPGFYDRVIPWDKIVAIRTQSFLGLFRIVHITVGQRFEVGYYCSRYKLPFTSTRDADAYTVSVKKLGIPVWMTNGKLKQVLIETKGFYEAYGNPPDGAEPEEKLQFDRYHTV